ncbi:GPCR fungal pheromone mating factor [Xylaria sp. CBS 124048]|nr:GPCR fungal pheromone mating factor [Xylaria sp. CBS 124048]
MAPPATWGLTANLIARVIFAFISILLNWVPLRLLIRNGEFPAIVLIIDLVIMNLITIANSIIWRNDDYTQWWDGAILCDAEVYLAVPLQTVYSAAIFTVMYNLAEQVKVAAIRPGLEPGRKTRRNLIQAAIIFPVPLIQIGFTYFDLAQRYLVGTLIGCFAFYDSSWPKTLVYDAPSAVFALLSVPYAILLWKRYDAIAKRTLSIFRSSDRVSLRINRTRRRLSRMSLAILVIYLPVVLYYAISNGKDTAAAYQPYSFRRIRESNIPYPWDSILFVPSWVLPSTLINQPWLTIATSFAVVLFFGTTAEAQEMYWLYARHLGIDNFLKSLKWKGGIWGRNAAPTDSSSSPRNISPYPARDSMEYK